MSLRPRGQISALGADTFSLSSGGYSVHAQAAAYGGRDDGLFRSLIVDSSIMAFQNWTVESQTTGYKTSQSSVFTQAFG